MTESFSFTVDRHLVPNISVDGNIIWNQNNMDAINTTLGDSINESYVSADEDTQYLSVLDSTNEISLENLNITLSNPKLEVEENPDTFVSSEDLIEQTNEEINEQQVVVYTVEGSDDLYGIQVVQDEDGNLQKYQFQFRRNKDGQLEAIPETIQLLPMEEDIPEETTTTEDLEEEESGTNGMHSMHIFVQEDNSHEHILPDHHTIEEQEEEEMNEEHEEATLLYENENFEEESVDIKPGILALQNVKQEQQGEYEEEETTQSFPENLEEENVINFQPTTENTPEEESDNHLIEYVDQNSMVSEESVNNDTTETQQLDETLNNKSFEHIEVNPDMEVTQNEVQQEENTNDSDIDDYHIVEGVHITGDVEGGNDTEPITGKSSSINNTNILRHALKTNQEPRMKKDNKLYLYVVQHPEKENVDSLSLDMSNLGKQVKANPRSILKSSFQAKIENEEDERLGKRFARCKEAVQARIFHNFINKTTIPQAPIRKDRLPRKQKIKPVERMDEEIVVQEVMVSSNGFVETVDGGINKENYLEITDYVELSDSDDDYDPKRVSRKKKKHRKKKIEITISDDSDVSNDSVIELDESDDDIQYKEQEVPKSFDDSEMTPTKRRRGRPPKNPKSDSLKSECESPMKKLRIETIEDSVKPEIPCPKCDKTFPSQNSLKTHLQHHNLQSSLRNVLPELKYKCDDCGSSFKNSILLKKHQCLKNYNCSICTKKFTDLFSFNLHKRSHAKEQLIRNTSGLQVSTKKNKMVDNETFKAPKKVIDHKCKTCGKLCSSLVNLNIHMKSHRDFICATCSTKFVSQLLLEKHLREKCVKSPKGYRKSIQLKIDNSKTPSDGSVEVSKFSSTHPKVDCPECCMKFLTYKALFKHKVLKHGLDTPDKSVLKETKKEKRFHSGVPATSKLRLAFAGLVKSQLDFNE